MRNVLMAAAFMPGGATSAAYAAGAAPLMPTATLHVPHATRNHA
jgi:hypothetical protein